MGLTRLAVSRPLTVLMALLGLVIMGGVGYTYLKIDRLPPISIPFVSVNVAYTGASAQDMELLVTQSIENVVAGTDFQDGERLPDAPENNASFGAQYNFNLGAVWTGFARADYIHVGNVRSKLGLLRSGNRLMELRHWCEAALCRSLSEQTER